MTTTISSLLGHSLPEKNLTRLSLVETSKTDMQAWVASLPIMNVGETAKSLYQTLQELCRLRTNEETRFEMLEAMRPAIYTILQALSKHYFNQSVLLPDRASRIAALAYALRSHLALGYRIVVQECVEKLQTRLNMIGFGRRPTLYLTAVSLQRAINELGGVLLEQYALYLSPPSGVWLDLHSLYRIATAYGLAQQKIADSHYRHIRELSSSDAYLRILLLAASHTNKLRQSEIRQIYEASELWASLLKIRPQQGGNDLLVVDGSQDQPPSYVSKIGSSPSALYVDASKLVQHLQVIASTPTNQLGRSEAGLSTSLLQHLINVWMAPTERTFTRRPYQGQLWVSLGLTATHYHLADNQDFESVLNIRQHLSEEEANFFLKSEKEAKPLDPWEIDYHSTEQQNGGPKNHAPADNKNGKTSGHHPQLVNIINTSPGGYCIRWEGEPPLILRTGEILALREEDANSWNIGVVRWVKQLPNEGAEAGLEILSTRAKPCGARVIKKNGDSTEYMRTLLMPETKSLHRPATLITPNLTFRSGYKIVIRLGHEEVKAQLTTEGVSTQSFSQFEFALLQSHDKSASHQSTDQPVHVENTTDDFDSLWNNL